MGVGTALTERNSADVIKKDVPQQKISRAIPSLKEVGRDPRADALEGGDHCQNDDMLTP